VEKLWWYVKPFSYNTSVSRTDRQTDGQTDRITISISRVSSSMLTHDKNAVEWCVPLFIWHVAWLILRDSFNFCSKLSNFTGQFINFRPANAKNNKVYMVWQDTNKLWYIIAIVNGCEKHFSSNKSTDMKTKLCKPQHAEEERLVLNLSLWTRCNQYSIHYMPVTLNIMKINPQIIKHNFQHCCLVST